MNLIILSIPVYFILIGIELLYNWWSQRKLYRLGDAYANIGCGIFEQVTGLFVKVISFGIYVWVYNHWRFFTIENSITTIVILWILVDFCYYWAHRWSHEINLFWVGHVIHHQSEDYNLSVALRQGALQKFFTFPVYLPLALAGFDPLWFLNISALNTLYQFWIHTESIKKMGWFEYLFNTPSHHRVHHGRDPKYIDKNHAGSLIIWDKMFGTFQKEEEPPHYGITKPTHTFNPVKAHWKAVTDLYQEVQSVKGWNKVKLLFHAPGWLPEENGGTQQPPEIDHKNYLKFDFKINSNMATYLFIQFVLSLGFAALFLFSFDQLNLSFQLLGATVIIITLIALGMLFESSYNGLYFEGLRFTLLSLYLHLQYQHLAITLVTLIFGLLSLWWSSKNTKKHARLEEV